jgi:putative ABC transport system permease protein
MFKLNFKIALRNIWKNKISSFINISGLAIGLASCLLLLLYVDYEQSFDTQTKDPDHIYKVLMNNRGTNGEIESTIGNTSNVIGPLLKQEYAGVKAVSRIDNVWQRLVANGNKSMKRMGTFADPDILNIYNYTFIAGDASTALAAPNNVVITESTARALFGTIDVLNKALRFDDKINLKITGIIKDLPGNTSVKFDYLMPWSLNEALNSWIQVPSWGNFNYVTLVKMDPSTDIMQFNLSIKGLVSKHIRSYWETSLFPLKSIHLYDTFVKGKSVGGKIEQVRLFMGLAIGILLIACINFMNISTAKSEKRAKEVSIKKTIGATRGSLITQFLMESLVLTLLSAVMAIALIEVGIPLFNNLLNIGLMISYSNISIWLTVAAVVLITGLVSGSYPAFYLSSFSPIQILRKRKPNGGIFSINLRQVLVVGQFSFAIILIIATTVIYRQIQYIKDRSVGYQLNGLVEMPQEGELHGKFELLKERLLKSGAVSSMYQSSGTISNRINWLSGMQWEGSSEADKHTDFSLIATTYDFVKTSGVKLVDGRDFSRTFASDTAAILLSQSAAKLMSLTHPVGQTVIYQERKTKIIGVFEDFILGSPEFKGNPLVIAFDKKWDGTITMRLNAANDVSENMAMIEKIVKEVNPSYPVELKFVDQLYAEKLKGQKVLGTLSNLFGGLAIFISCMGLFGLASYSAEQRTKEIGVRKVLGASLASLMQLLSFSFLKMVVVAIIIAVPVANYLMNNWLKNFDFHTDISWIVTMLTALGTLAIALFTVSFQAYRAASANPVDALKYE